MRGLDAGLFQCGSGLGNGVSGVVDRLAAAAQDDVAIGVAGGDEDCGLAVFCVAEERVRVRCGENGIDGDLNIAGRGVLEANRARYAGDELAVNLALGCARADGAPADQAGDVLGRDHVEELGAGGHAHLREVEKKVTGEAQAVVDFE